MTRSELHQFAAALSHPAPGAGQQAASGGPLTRQQISDQFAFLEGLVREDTYRCIVDTAFEIASRAAPPAPAVEAVTDDRSMRLALIETHNAIEELMAWDARRNYLIPYKVRDPLRTALASIRAALALARKGGAK